MAAVEDTRDARERGERLLVEVETGVIVRTLRAEMPYGRFNEKHGAFPLSPDEQRTMIDLVSNALVVRDAQDSKPLMLTDKGRAVLSARPDAHPPCPPPLVCDGVIHAWGEQPPAVVVCAETTGELKRMALCRDCGQRYALDAACLALAGFELDPSAPVAIHLIPLPQPGASGEHTTVNEGMSDG